MGAASPSLRRRIYSMSGGVRRLSWSCWPRLPLWMARGLGSRHWVVAAVLAAGGEGDEISNAVWRGWKVKLFRSEADTTPFFTLGSKL